MKQFSFKYFIKKAPETTFAIIFFSTVLINTGNCQEAPTGEKLSVDRDLVLVEKYKTLGDLKEATRYLNLAAMQVWEAKNYPDAIRYFNLSIDLNKQINNLSGIAKLNSNLGMIYADLQQYDKSLGYFQTSLDYRLKHGEKSEIISTYINKAVVLNNLKKYDDAAASLEEALKLATEMSDAPQMKSCYGMLAETYEKAGNQERTLHYFNLYRTFHEMIQRNKVNEANKETEVAKLQALKAELENKENEIALLNDHRELALTEDELKKLNSEVRGLIETKTKKELAISLLQREVELDQLQIADVEARSSVQKIWIAVSIAGFIGLAVFAMMLFRNFRFKKKVNLQLSEQNEEIKVLNENLEAQVQKRTEDLQRTLKNLENRNRDLDQFSQVISHNLRGPVASILGLGKIINQKDASDPINIEIFSRLISSTQDLDGVVSDLSMILNAKDDQSLPKTTIEVKDSIAQAEKLLKDEIALANAKIAVESGVLKVECVKAYLESILFNLISNSIKYSSPERQPQVLIKTEIINGHFSLVVADNGVGIPLSAHSKIFEPYKRLSLNGKGKGLGLYLVKTQVEAMGGTIQLSSDEQIGSTFTVKLPLNRN